MIGSTKFKDLTGQKFGRLTVLSIVLERKYSRIQYLCKCDCGTEKVLTGNTLATGNTKSCGCLHIEHAISLKLSHNLCDVPPYSVWKNMRRRCYSPENKSYRYYGGRGIKICKRWQKYKNFYDDMYDTYIEHIKTYGRKNTCLERIDNNKDYSPKNCRWATRTEQSNNKRDNHILTFNGITLTLAQWAERQKLTYSTLLFRIEEGWPIKEALTVPFAKKRDEKGKFVAFLKEPNNHQTIGKI